MPVALAKCCGLYDLFHYALRHILYLFNQDFFLTNLIELEIVKPVINLGIFVEFPPCVSGIM